jgi:hypothetical protein
MKINNISKRDTLGLRKWKLGQVVFTFERHQILMMTAETYLGTFCIYNAIMPPILCNINKVVLSHKYLKVVTQLKWSVYTVLTPTQNIQIVLFVL